jgi:hypothetical protein
MSIHIVNNCVVGCDLYNTVVYHVFELENFVNSFQIPGYIYHEEHSIYRDLYAH